MPYVLTNGSSYIRYLPNNSATLTPHKNQARIFQSEVRAQNSCECLPNIYRKMGFYVNELYADDGAPCSATEVDQPHESELMLGNEEETKLSAAMFTETDMVDFEHLIEEVSRFEDVIITLMGAKSRIKEILKVADMEILDIEHIAEFSVLNAPKAYKVYKRLHDARKLRRQCKNCLSAIGYLSPLYNDYMEGKYYSKTLAGLTTRQYEPRVLHEFYDEICGPKI